ncbi:uncharacterized protein EV154DRAFT_519734, partial [Mucor mucedo]|uniref:uncharacterized protein n=1 Tax=Mucor mucedo TaxID=29922 RepID=UPI00221F9752
VEHEKSPPPICGGSYFNIIRAIIFAIATINVPKLFSRAKFLIKLVVISLVAWVVTLAKEQTLSKV